MQCRRAHPELLKLVVSTWLTNEREWRAAASLGGEQWRFEVGVYEVEFDKAALEKRSGSCSAV